MCRRADRRIPCPRRQAATPRLSQPQQTGADVLVDAGFVFPDQCAGLGVERKHVVVAGGDIHDAILDDRRSLHRIFQAKARAEVHYPRALQVLHVVAVDLGERRKTRVVPIAADGEPFLAGGLAEIALRPGDTRDDDRKHKRRDGRKMRLMMLPFQATRPVGGVTRMAGKWRGHLLCDSPGGIVPIPGHKPGIGSAPGGNLVLIIS